MAHYVKIAKDPTYWFVKDGKRKIVGSPVEMYALGLYPVHKISPEELEEIPLAGESDQDEWSEGPKADEWLEVE